VSGPLSAGERGTTSGAQPRPTPPTPSSSIHSTDMPVAERTASSHLTSIRRNLSPSEFNTAMVHFYRGEVQRSNTWRNRLDTTTNWAVLTAGATLSFAFSAPANPHFVILINSVLVAFFLFMEARRYRYYEIWSSRVRVLETEYFARLLSPGGQTPDEAWAAHLASDLMTPHFTISEWEAVGRRLRRNYLWIFALLALSWNLKVYLHPEPALNFDAFIERAAVGLVPGKAMFVFGIIFNVGLVVFAIATVRLREATGEVLPRHEFSFPRISRMTNWAPAAIQRSRTMRRAKRARTRTRSRTSTTGEWKKVDLEEEAELVNRES
jgi:uncharacterized membrane protein